MKKRIISAIVMLLFFVPILLLGDIYYTILGSILGVMALYEVIRLSERIPIVIKVISFFVGLFLILYNYKYLSFENFYDFRIMVIIFFLYSFSLIINGDIDKYNYKDSMNLMLMVTLIGFMFNCFIRIRLLGLYPVIYCFIISIMTDTFAYFIGSKFGKHKLIPCVSPNKTIEGSIGGSFFGSILGTVFYVMVICGVNILEIFIVSLILTMIAQFGDLFFSSIKRCHKIKDFSNLIPGHGGILDRLDSVLFVILGFLLYIGM